jgi:hypothetical protein
VPISRNRAIHVDTRALKTNRLLFKEISGDAWSACANYFGTRDIAGGSHLLLGRPYPRRCEQSRGEHNARKDVSAVAHARTIYLGHDISGAPTGAA